MNIKTHKKGWYRLEGRRGSCVSCAVMVLKCVLEQSVGVPYGMEDKTSLSTPLELMSHSVHTHLDRVRYIIVQHL